jgi:hypothetical protein
MYRMVWGIDDIEEGRHEADKFDDVLYFAEHNLGLSEEELEVLKLGDMDDLGPCHNFTRTDDAGTFWLHVQDTRLLTEIKIPLPANGGTLRCGPGRDTEWGGYVRICDPDGNEILYWESTEWEQEGEGESVIGAIFNAANKPLDELIAGRRLEDGVWVHDGQTPA